MKVAIKTLGALALVGSLVMSGNVMAQSDDSASLPRVAAAVNESGPYAGLFDELNNVLRDDFLWRRSGAVTNILSFGGPFTVFAPTDGAFEAVEQLLACNGLTLFDVPDIRRTVLLSHATGGALLAADVVALDEITMASGVTFSQSGGVITDAIGQEVNILITDVTADNGVIHVIDKVLIPADLGLVACGG